MSEEIQKTGVPLNKWLIMVVAIVLLVLCLIPILIDQKRDGDFIHACQNARSLGYALWNFEDEYGSTPNDSTRLKLIEEYPDSEAVLGIISANDYYRQLHVARYVDVDAPFYAKGVSTVMIWPPDPNDDAFLGPGECGFSMVVWEESQKLPGSAPVMLTPLLKGESAVDVKVAKQYFDGKLLVVCRDMKVLKLKIDKNGKAMLNGKDYFDWSQPHWGGQKPKIVWPE